MIVNTHYSYCGGGGVPGERATIVVTAPSGSTVTATLGSTTLRASEVSGSWTFNVREFGVWTINASKGSESASTTVNVTEDTTYSITIGYTIPITITGYGAATTGTKKTYAWVTIDGVDYITESTIQASAGSTVRASVTTRDRDIVGVIHLNGVEVARAAYLNTATYDIVVTKPITYRLNVPSNNRGQVFITT